MKIHGFVYLTFGTAIAIISKIVGTKFILFLYFGIAFALYGIWKIIAENRKQEVQPASQYHQATGNPYLTRHHRVTRDHRLYVHYCRWCGNQTRPYDNFCSQCGQRIIR